MDIALQRQTSMKRALVWSNILSEPLFTLYMLLSFILYKDLGASAFQIAMLTMLKPVVTALSFYWSSGLKGRGERLKSNVVWAGIWMRAPFLLCPWIDSSWFLVAAAANYMFFYRAASPAWLEMLRRNLQGKERGKAFAWSSALGYCEGIILSLGMGVLLDGNPGLWKVFFFGASVIGLFSVVVQSKVSIAPDSISIRQEPETEQIHWKERLIRPWRESYLLLKERPDFAKFQWGFMLYGFGIMLVQPALCLFMVDTLGISYLEMASAISIAKGLGFVLSSPLWSRWMEKEHISQVASAVFVLVGLFPLVLSLSTMNLAWFYIAYFLYGIGQGGSHLVWNLSGPIFAGKEESSRYTGVSVMLGGIRGGIAPPLGSWLAVAWGPVGVLLLSGVFCFYSSLSLLKKSSPVKNTFT